MAAYDKTLGALLLCSWLNCSLFTIESMQIYTYFNRFPRDTWWNKVCVCLALFADIGGMVSNLASVYLYTITHFGDTQYAQSQPWSIPLYVVSSCVSGLVVQTWLSFRIFKLTKQVAYPIVFGLISAGSLAGGLGAVVIFFTTGSILYTERAARFGRFINLWLSCAAGVDILIALCLVVILARQQTSFRGTENLLRRLMLASVKTGSITAGAALIAIVLFHYDPASNVCVFFSLSLGRLYTISMMMNLNSRGEDSSDRGQTSNDFKISNHRTGAQTRDRDLEGGPRGVNITRDTVTRIDREIELSPTSTAHQNRSRNEKYSNDDDRERAVVVDAIPYQSSNHRDEWDSSTPEPDTQHSQVELVRNASWDRDVKHDRQR